MNDNDKCARCSHRRDLHHDDGCHYLGAHGGKDHRCGGQFSHYVALAPCPSFVEASPPEAGTP